MSDSDTLISVIIPMKNEEGNVTPLYERMKSVFKNLIGYSYEFIYVDDGSNDDSVKCINHLSKKDKQVRLIELSRNFGKEIATTAGLNNAKGSAAIMIDADLQHPPEKYLSSLKSGKRDLMSLSADDPMANIQVARNE